jgi:hypothetical protein
VHQFGEHILLIDCTNYTPGIVIDDRIRNAADYLFLREFLELYGFNSLNRKRRGSDRSRFRLEQVVQMECLKQASAHIGGNFQFLSICTIQIKGFGHGIENHAAIFATGHVALKFLAKVVAQLAIDKIGDVSQ